jgi:DNA polymerase IV
VSVFHIKLNDFELQAERMLDASIRSKAVAIISSHHANGTIVCLSPEAEQEGLNQGMKVSLARRMSHSAQLIPYNTSLYSRMNQYVYHTLASFSPIVEPAAFGRFYADMSGMQSIYKDLTQAGYRIFKEIQFKSNLDSRIGISNNKLVSQISTDVIHEHISQVKSGEEPQFLSPLPSQILPSSQEISVNRIINFLFLRKVQSIQKIISDYQTGSILFGSHYPRISREAKGEDNSIVQPPRMREHVMVQKVLSSDTNDENILRPVVQELAEQVALQLRNRMKIAGTLTLEIYYTDGYKSTRKGSIHYNDNQSVIGTCTQLFTRAHNRRNRIRSILIDATKLKLTANQLNLFDDAQFESKILSVALDKIRGRYGFDVIKPLAALAG